MTVSWPYRLKSDYLLIFLHIPKTAGTSFNALLERHFAPDEVVPYHTAGLPVSETATLIGDTPAEQLRRYRYLATHLDYSVHEHFPQTPIFITMLRHPIERVLSNFAHLKRHRTRLYDVVKHMSLQDFLTSPETRDQYYNRQTCQLAGVTLEPDSPLPPDESLLETAKQHLEKMVFVGLQEHFAASVHLLNHTFGWSDPYYEWRNVSQQRVGWFEQPRDTMVLLTETNRLDLALYRHAEGLFNRRLERMLGQLGRKADELSAIEQGVAWRSFMRLHALRKKLIPDESRRERLYRYLQTMITRE